jgi:hypothetical protein
MIPIYYGQTGGSIGTAPRKRARSRKPSTNAMVRCRPPIRPASTRPCGIISVTATNSSETATVLGWMRANAVEDFFAHGGKIRDDGRMVHDMYSCASTSPRNPKACGISMSIWTRYPAIRRFGRWRTAAVHWSGLKVRPNGQAIKHLLPHEVGEQTGSENFRLTNLARLPAGDATAAARRAGADPAGAAAAIAGPAAARCLADDRSGILQRVDTGGAAHFRLRACRQGQGTKHK